MSAVPSALLVLAVEAPPVTLVVVVTLGLHRPRTLVLLTKIFLTPLVSSCAMRITKGSAIGQIALVRMEHLRLSSGPNMKNGRVNVARLLTQRPRLALQLRLHPLPRMVLWPLRSPRLEALLVERIVLVPLVVDDPKTGRVPLLQPRLPSFRDSCLPVVGGRQQ